jgi:hypothetical protein
MNDIESLRQQWREVVSAMRLIDDYVLNSHKDLGQIRVFRDELVKRKIAIEVEGKLARSPGIRRLKGF